MRAAKWQLDDAKKRIKSTLEWRRDYKPDLIPPEEVRIESETGKLCVSSLFSSTIFDESHSASSTASTTRDDRSCTCGQGARTRKRARDKCGISSGACAYRADSRRPRASPSADAGHVAGSAPKTSCPPARSRSSSSSTTSPQRSAQIRLSPSRERCVLSPVQNRVQS